MKKTILLVEDSKVQKRAAEKILLKAGYLVLAASDGEEALQLAGESIPELILLDLLLPGISGEEVLYKLKLDPRTAQIPVIVVSHLAPANADKLKAAGAVDYFEKTRFLEDIQGEADFLNAIARVLREFEGRIEMGRQIAMRAGRQSG